MLEICAAKILVDFRIKYYLSVSPTANNKSSELINQLLPFAIKLHSELSDLNLVAMKRIIQLRLR